MIRPLQVVRARNHATGDHYTTTRHLATLNGDDILEDHAAVDQYGRWLDPKPHQNITPARDERGRFTTQEEA